MARIIREEGNGLVEHVATLKHLKLLDELYGQRCLLLRLQVSQFDSHAFLFE